MSSNSEGLSLNFEFTSFQVIKSNINSRFANGDMVGGYTSSCKTSGPKIDATTRQSKRDMIKLFTYLTLSLFLVCLPAYLSVG